MTESNIRERSGLNATPLNGPSESWWTSGADIALLCLLRSLFELKEGEDSISLLLSRLSGM